MGTDSGGGQWGPVEAGSASFTEPRKDPRGHEVSPFGLEVEKMRPGVVKWLSGGLLRLRKARRCHLAPPPKVVQLISVIECASRSAAMPSSNLESGRHSSQVHEKAVHFAICATARL